MTRTVLERYKVEDEEVKQFLKKTFPNSWQAQYKDKCTDKGREYYISLVRRRYGYKMAYDQEFWYDTSNNIVLTRSKREKTQFIDEADFYDFLMLFVLFNKETEMLQGLVEDFMKPAMSRWIESSESNQWFNNVRDPGAEPPSRPVIKRIKDLMKSWVRSDESTSEIALQCYWACKAIFAAGGRPYPTDEKSIETYDFSWLADSEGSGSTELLGNSKIASYTLVSSLNLRLTDPSVVKTILNDNLVTPIEAFGFSNELYEAGFTDADNIRDLEEAFASDDPEVNKKLSKLQENLGRETDRELKDDEDILNMRQCFLMSQNSFTISSDNRKAPEWENDDVNLSEYFTGADGAKRIYRTNESRYLFNKLLSKAPANGLWYSQYGALNTMNKKLLWVFSDSQGNLIKEELFLTQDRMVEDYWDYAFDKDFKDSIKDLNSIEKEEAMMSRQKNFGAWSSVENLRKGHYYLKNISVLYEGTNPSTARKDVQVKMEFQISSLGSLDLPISNKIITNEKTGDGYFVKLYNLITLPVTNKINTRSGLGSLNPSSFNPDYSRVRLVVYEGENDDNCISVDLSTIDHSISRDSSNGSCTLTINYRGYFEQVLTMPFTDVLADQEKRQARRAIDFEMERIANSGKCSSKALREAKKLEFEYYKNSTAKMKSSRFIDELNKRNKLYNYTLNADPLIESWNLNENPDPSKVLRTFRYSRGRPNISVLYKDGELVDNITDEVHEKYTKSRYSGGQSADFSTTLNVLDLFRDPRVYGEKIFVGSCFFLGDLFDLALDTIYEDEETKKKLKLEFIFGSIDVTSEYSDGPEIQNPLNFAVDVVVFMRWFEQRVVAKKISFYPLTTFFRDMIQTLVVDLKTRFCAIDKEEPPMYRMAFINTTETREFTTNGDDIDMSNPWGTGKVNPILPRSPWFESGADDTRNYCIFYQQTESRFQTIKYNDRLETPRIFYGIKSQQFNFISDVSFSKTDAPFLREARYFNNNFGDLSLLSNVYNLSFSFKNMYANKDFYPGTIFEFVLLDWGPQWGGGSGGAPIDSVPIIDGVAGDYRVFGEANPHKIGTISNITGFGGYYIATKVEYVLGETNRDYEIKIEAKFIGANESLLMRRGQLEENVAQPAVAKSDEECLERLREIADTVAPEKEETEESALPNIGDLIE